MPWIDTPLGESTLTPEAAAGWEEVYGADYPFTVGDVPVISNGLCRVRYDPTHTPGFRIDVWNPALFTPGWIEQAKIVLRRRDLSAGGAGINPLDTLITAGVAGGDLEYTPDRAVIWAVMRAGSDALSRELVYITLQRGWTGPRFEMYTAPGTDGTSSNVGASVEITPSLDDPNGSVTCLDAAAAGEILATAGSGSPLLSSAAPVGAGTFTGENWVHFLRQSQAYAIALAVVQAATEKEADSSGLAYGRARNTARVRTDAGGYVSAHVGLYAAAADQVIEAEAAINGSSSTVALVNDAAASAGRYVTDTQATPVANTLFRATTSLEHAKYRLFARVRTDAAATGSFSGFLQHAGVANAFGGAPVTIANATPTWIDLGETTAPAANPDFAFNAWRSAGAGAAYVDRVELVKVEDRIRPGAPFDGARDLGAMILADTRPQQLLLARG